MCTFAIFSAIIFISIANVYMNVWTKLCQNIVIYLVPGLLQKSSTVGPCDLGLRSLTLRGLTSVLLEFLVYWLCSSNVNLFVSSDVVTVPEIFSGVQPLLWGVFPFLKPYFRPSFLPFMLYLFIGRG
mgnify:CR=1 FL=1